MNWKSSWLQDLHRRRWRTCRNCKNAIFFIYTNACYFKFFCFYKTLTSEFSIHCDTKSWNIIKYSNNNNNEKISKIYSTLDSCFFALNSIRNGVYQKPKNNFYKYNKVLNLESIYKVNIKIDCWRTLTQNWFSSFFW